MASNMTIGDFSRATRLSSKALRFYHQAGILHPAVVDPSNGYRHYNIEQIAHAQVIRQLRQLAVPVDTIREILSSPDVTTRNQLISDHLRHLEDELKATQTAVASLRGLLETAPTRHKIEHRSVLATPALVLREVIDLANLGAWYRSAWAVLDTNSGFDDRAEIGPRGGIWDTDLFVEERGEAALFYPVRQLGTVANVSGRVRAEMLPAMELAIIVHHGPDETMAQTYGELGAYVTEHEIGVSGPIRETYLRPSSPGSPDVITEVGWPIFRTGR